MTFITYKPFKSVGCVTASSSSTALALLNHFDGFRVLSTTFLNQLQHERRLFGDKESGGLLWLMPIWRFPARVGSMRGPVFGPLARLHYARRFRKGSDT